MSGEKSGPSLPPVYNGCSCMHQIQSEIPKVDGQTGPPTYSDATQGYSYNQGQQNQPLMGQPMYTGQPIFQPATGYTPYPGQQVVYGQPQTTTTSSVVVAYPGQPLAAGHAPPDYFTQAIFVTLCCFWPTGIFAIMRASDARSAVARGDLASAQTSSRSAKFMINVSIAIGILSIVLMCVIFGVYFGIVMHNINNQHYDD